MWRNCTSDVRQKQLQVLFHGARIELVLSVRTNGTKKLTYIIYIYILLLYVQFQFDRHVLPSGTQQEVQHPCGHVISGIPSTLSTPGSQSAINVCI